MARETIAERIEKLSKALPEGRADELRSLTSDLRTNLEEASQSLVRSMYVLALTWLASFAIGAGLVSEGEIASFKVTAVKSLLVFVPALVGFEYYLIASAFALT